MILILGNAALQQNAQQNDAKSVAGDKYPVY
jgi:hypothetical protein